MKIRLKINTATKIQEKLKTVQKSSLLSKKIITNKLTIKLTMATKGILFNSNFSAE